jgi:hypothetical protein
MCNDPVPPLDEESVKLAGFEKKTGVADVMTCWSWNRAELAKAKAKGNIDPVISGTPDK